jgi:hypothetical protein
MYLEKIGMRRLATQNNPGPMDTNQFHVRWIQGEGMQGAQERASKKSKSSLVLYVAAISL